MQWAWRKLWVTRWNLEITTHKYIPLLHLLKWIPLDMQLAKIFCMHLAFPLFCIFSKDNHLYVPCGSICDWDQNWIKRSKPFCRADQGAKVTSKLLKINDQELTAAMWPFTLENQAIRASKGNDQAIKHTFCQSKNLIAVTNASTGDI